MYFLHVSILLLARLILAHKCTFCTFAPIGLSGEVKLLQRINFAIKIGTEFYEMKKKQ